LNIPNLLISTSLDQRLEDVRIAEIDRRGIHQWRKPMVIDCINRNPGLDKHRNDGGPVRNRRPMKKINS
jgi:hypothetical protein